jgi:hypothetical protein
MCSGFGMPAPAEPASKIPCSHYMRSPHPVTGRNRFWRLWEWIPWLLRSGRVPSDHTRIRIAVRVEFHINVSIRTLCSFRVTIVATSYSHTFPRIRLYIILTPLLFPSPSTPNILGGRYLGPVSVTDWFVPPQFCPRISFRRICKPNLLCEPHPLLTRMPLDFSKEAKQIEKTRIYKPRGK